ncbi:predicted protein [Nematostella vectensis]|uniref:C2H2-type domain-containing protein n=1 Tax=Nematostella vectensis TaxID=45351 RepID=A7T3A8_NEMVE|nr:predicted protein [Nematostella vectensis]|eukprot:XP_001621659.1 hypothetical protein NEMVEDRAFT_v1g221738 [Nematostella vectensis]
MARFRCLWPLCVFAALHFSDLLSHINIVNSDNPNFSVICGIEGCTAKYSKYNSLHRPISRRHRSWLGQPQECEDGVALSSILLPGNQMNCEYEQSTGNVSEDQLTERQSSVTNPDNATPPDPHGLDAGHPPYFLASVAHAHQIDLKRNAAVYCLGLKEKNKLSQRSIDNILAIIQFIAQTIVSIIESVMFPCMEQHLQSNHKLYENKLIHNQALQIVLYHDEIQLCNAVGNRVRTHKLYMFYFIILNLPLQYRTKLQDIHLVAIARSVDVKEYGFDVVLKPLLLELEQLATPDGYQFTLSEGTYINLQGALAAYIADTPASHEAAGFKEGVGLSFKKCRHCHATFEEMQSNFLEENFHARSLQEHLHYLDPMKECEDSLLQHLSMVYGVNRASILLDFPYFDVCEQMPQDVMHVLFEGVIPYTVKLVLHYFIRIEKQLTIQQLNRKLIGFNYAYFNKKYQPNPFSQQDIYIDGDCKFSQDADQM